MSRTSQPNTPRDARAAKGVELILGAKGSNVQAVVFSRDTWDVAKAKKWLKQHGYRSLGMEVVGGKIRARQMDGGKMDNPASRKYEPVNREDLSMYGGPYYLPENGKYVKVKWEGSIGSFDRIPVEKWTYLEGPKKGTSKESYSVIFYQLVGGTTATGLDINKHYRIEYLAPWGEWEKISKTVKAGQILKELNKVKKDKNIGGRGYEVRVTDSEGNVVPVGNPGSLSEAESNPAYHAKLEDGYVKVYRGNELIVAGIYDPRSTGRVRGIEFLDEKHLKINKIRMPAMKAMADFVKRQNNPGTIADAESMSRSFHGREPSEIIDLLEPEKYHSNLTKLGTLRMLEVVLPGDMESGKVVPIQFEEDGDGQVELACTPDGQQLLLLAGDQTLDLEALEVPAGLQAKDYIELGMVHSITYFTDKHHLEGPKYQKKGCEYVHIMGESGGEPPSLIYDSQNQRMLLAGGTYKVEERGIVN